MCPSVPGGLPGKMDEYLFEIDSVIGYLYHIISFRHEHAGDIGAYIRARLALDADKAVIGGLYACNSDHAAEVLHCRIDLVLDANEHIAALDLGLHASFEPFDGIGSDDPAAVDDDRAFARCLISGSMWLEMMTVRMPASDAMSERISTI